MGTNQNLMKTKMHDSTKLYEETFAQRQFSTSYNFDQRVCFAQKKKLN